MAEPEAGRGSLAGAVALTMAVTTSVVLFVLPMGSRQSATAGPDGSQVSGPVEEVRLPEMMGTGEAATAALLFVPIVITGLPLVIRRWELTLACAALLTLLCFLAGLSIGIFYVPAAIAMWVAAKRSAAR